MKYLEGISIDFFVECGPSKVLSGLIKRSVKEASIISLDNYDYFLDRENLI
jgi:(acyl-carrier-protein) S-malonyltransferase